MSADIRPTAPPAPADDYAFVLAAWIREDWRPHATAVRYCLDGRLPALPPSAREWLEELAKDHVSRGRAATAQRLLARVGGAS